MTLDQVELLLVEDDQRDAELTLRALRKINLANGVHHVSDGVEALDYVFATGAYAGRRIENAPKVILLDLKLPKVDGIEVLRRIRADERTRKTPVVALTSSKVESDMARTYELGINSYIVKPVEFEKFTEAIRQIGMYWLLLNNVSR